MKIVYVGSGDYLAESLMERLAKEEHELFLISDKDINTTERKSYRYRFFKLSDNARIMEDIFASVRPNAVIFTGLGYLNESWDQGQQDYFSMLSLVLEACTLFQTEQFLYFSSLEVYGQEPTAIMTDTIGNAANYHPLTKKGFCLAQGECVVEMYRNQYPMCGTVVRCGEFFSRECSSGSHEFLGQMMQEVLEQDEILIKKDRMMQPLYVQDVAEAVKRILDSKAADVYQLCSSNAYMRSQVYQYLCDYQGKSVSILVEESENQAKSENKKLKKKLEWVDFHQLDDMLWNREILFCSGEKPEKKQKKERDKRGKTSALRKTIETIAVFLFFFSLYYVTKDHALFSKVQWLLIYILFVSLFQGVKQSALAVVLAGAGYMWCQNINMSEITNFSSYVEYILVIVEFLFFGIIVAYVVDSVKEELRIRTQDMEILQGEYKELKDINKSNVIIKNEYERRILETKMGLPRLYSLLSQINILEPERVLMQVLRIVAELLNTQTVAVYRMNQNSSYARLAASMNRASVMEGNSWNLANYPGVLEGIAHSDIYEGDIWNGEPAIVATIHSPSVTALIVVKELPIESMSLYHFNLLRTLNSMVTEALAKALEYENATLGIRYLEGTSVLSPIEFEKMVAIANEKEERSLAPFSILRVLTAMEEAHVMVESVLREEDCVGVDKKGILFILLNNTLEKDVHIVLERLQKKGILAEVAGEFQIGEEK